MIVTLALPDWLEEATAQLQSAESARDRVRALTGAISALEAKRKKATK